MSFKHFLKPSNLKLKDKQLIAPDTYIFNFAIEEPLHWHAGQYGILEIKLPSGRTGRKPFAIASAPNEKIITIVTKIKPDNQDSFKLHMLQLKKGSGAKLRGPIGSMHIKDHHKNYAFLATGIAIAPFRAILKQLEDETTKPSITLFYVNSGNGHYFKEELNSLKSKFENLQIIYITKPDRITGQTIEDTLGKAMFDTTYFLSGSAKLINNYKRTLMGLGIASGQIKNNLVLGKNTYPMQPAN